MTVESKALEVLNLMAEQLQDMVWRFKHKQERFYLKRSARSFFYSKVFALDEACLNGELKSYWLGMNLIDWPYRVVWAEKTEGKVSKPEITIMYWKGNRIATMEE